MRRAVLWSGLIAGVILQVCGGYGAARQTPKVLAKSTFATTALPASQTIGSGEIFGADNQFTPNDGSPQETTIDGVRCVNIKKMNGTYHIHVFVGILINGNLKALPDGAGMYEPAADRRFNGRANTHWTASANCLYNLHTHDASGVVHIESPTSASRATASIYKLGTFFDIWHQTLTASQVAQFVAPSNGPLRVYVAQVHRASGLPPASIQRSKYTLYTGNPRNIPLYTHTSIWLEIGPTYVTPSQLPVLNYYTKW